MLDKQLIQDKIRLIQNDLLHLKEYQDLSVDEVIKNYEKHKVIERIIEIVVNEAVDINQHVIVELGEGKLPFDYKESFLLLGDLGILPKEFSQEISKSVGLRNILVHQYRTLDEKIFYHSIKDCLSQYTNYCRYILEFLKKAERLGK